MQKRQASKPVPRRHVFFKFLLYMKLSVFLLALCMQVYSSGLSQGKISLNLKDVEIKKALNIIQRISSYRFIYNDDILPAGARVNINVRDAAIQDVLDVLFRATPLRYKIMDDNLIVVSAGETARSVIDFSVKGTVHLRNRDESLGVAAGVAVKELGTGNGTTTNEKGEFSLTVRDGSAILQVSHVGYKTVEIPLEGKPTVDVILELDVKQLQDVVVTALGITRQKKSLSYATQTLKGEDLSNSREVNITSAMNGKVAGLTISKTNSGPGSSNRIIFRGNRSIGNTNQPLIVVDGVRIDNTPKAAADVTLFGARDNGDGISNINPDDVESMTVLTGASAAALYGSDASNGAIIITTKKGRTGKGVGVQISSSVSFESPMVYPKLQNVYGQGDQGVFQDSTNDSWGPQMTGQQVKNWTGKTQALTAQPDNFKNFFRTGTELINSASVSSGNDKAQTYFSYTNTQSKGIIPNNEYKRNNFNLRQTLQVTDKFSMDMKANYIVEDILNRPLTGAANRTMTTLFAMPRSLRLGDMQNFETQNPDGTLTQNYWAAPTPSFQNPYWSVYRNLYERVRNRFIGLLSVKYQLTPALSIQARTSIDYYTDNSEEKDYNNSFWIDYPGGGNYVVNKESNQQFNNDLLINYHKDLTDKLNLNLNAGASIEQFNFERTTLNDQGLIAPNLFSTTNAVALSPQQNNYFPYFPIARTEKQSLYASAQFSYSNYLFLDLTGRNDWNSTLPVNHASYFFPSVGLSAVLNEMLPLPVSISLLKLRASYAFVGNGTQFNQLNPSLSLAPGGNNGFVLVDRVLHDANLKPEETKSFETGLDLGLFHNRLGLELTYYKTNTINQILSIGVPNPSGYAFRIINAGNIQNQGVELLLNGKPVDGHDFKWNISFNFGMNRNKILYLDSLEKMPPLSSPETLGEIVAEEGKSFGGIYTSSFMRDPKGQILVDANGIPQVQTDVTKHFAGNYNPDWTAGITNTFQYKDWSFSFLIDMRKGGVIVSGTQALMAAAGTSQLTLPGREGGFVVPNSVMIGGGANSHTISAQDYWGAVAGANPVGELFTYSATNIRVREASLVYNFPSRVFAKTFIRGASLSLVGRNLFFLKNDAYGFDPESALGTGNNQGLEYASVPSTRNYGFYVKLNF
jgi:TonB-linked SusC/RagA family outer membrane protein